MNYLIITTLIWAFSFSFIGEVLAGRVDSYFAILLRIILASLIFIPFTNFKSTPNKLKFQIMAIGAIQIGLMYVFYYNSFLFLSVPEVALFTIFTPFYVTIIYDILNKKFHKLYLISVGVAVLGAFVIKYSQINSNFLIGFLMIQGANICFALGQTAYKIILEKNEGLNQKQIFGYFHFGALIIAIALFLTLGNFQKTTLNLEQALVILWLGVVASGIGYFLWNKGATIVDSGVLAIMNNALVPAALVVNLMLWKKDIELIGFTIGTALIFISLYLHNVIMKKYKAQIN